MIQVDTRSTQPPTNADVMPIRVPRMVEITVALKAMSNDGRAP